MIYYSLYPMVLTKYFSLFGPSIFLLIGIHSMQGMELQEKEAQKD